MSSLRITVLLCLVWISWPASALSAVLGEAIGVVPSISTVITRLECSNGAAFSNNLTFTLRTAEGIRLTSKNLTVPKKQRSRPGIVALILSNRVRGAAWIEISSRTANVRQLACRTIYYQLSLGRLRPLRKWLPQSKAAIQVFNPQLASRLVARGTTEKVAIVSDFRTIVTPTEENCDRADIDQDRQINASDLFTVASNLGIALAGDLNYDGRVDLSDLQQTASCLGAALRRPSSSSDSVESEGPDTISSFTNSSGTTASIGQSSQSSTWLSSSAATSSGVSESSSSAPGCSDGLDNDRDGLVDFPADPGCESGSALNENESIAVNAGCQNLGFHWQVHRPSSETPDDTAYSPRITQETAKLVNGGNVGLWPRLERLSAGDYRPINGGVPMLGSLSAHLSAVSNFMLRWYLPDTTYDGLLVLDWEEWRQWDALWNELDGSENRYKLKTREYMLSRDPTLSGEALEGASKAVWDAAALEYFLETQLLLQRLYPRAKVGIYMQIVRRYHAPYFGEQGDSYRAVNNWGLPLLREADAIFIDIYQFYRSYNDGRAVRPVNCPNRPNGCWWGTSWNPAAPNSDAWYDENRRYVKDNFLEAQRLANLVGGKDIYAYTWLRYHDAAPAVYRHELVSDPEIYLQLLYPLTLGAKGVIIWGSETQELESAHGAFQPYFNSRVAPIIENFCRGANPYYRGLFELWGNDDVDRALGLRFSGQ